jgi:hypothetical protein
LMLRCWLARKDSNLRSPDPVGIDRIAVDGGWEGERFPVFPLLPD